MKQQLLIKNVGNVNRINPFVCGFDPGKKGYIAFLSPDLKMCRTFPLKRAPARLQTGIVSLDIPLEKIALFNPLGVFIEDQFYNKSTMMDLGALCALAELHMHHFSAFELDCFRIVHARRWQRVLGVGKDSYRPFVDNLEIRRNPQDEGFLVTSTKDEAAAICLALYGIVILKESGLLKQRIPFKYRW